MDCPSLLKSVGPLLDAGQLSERSRLGAGPAGPALPPFTAVVSMRSGLWDSSLVPRGALTSRGQELPSFPCNTARFIVVFTE